MYIKVQFHDLKGEGLEIAVYGRNPLDWVTYKVEMFSHDVEGEDVAVPGLALEEEALGVEEERERAAKDGKRAADQRRPTWSGADDEKVVCVEHE